MVECMLSRWTELAKPLFMIPRDFRDRILVGGIDRGDKSEPRLELYPMQNEIRLNYMKWLLLGTEMDMFEVLCILIIYARCDMKKRLESKFIVDIFFL